MRAMALRWAITKRAGDRRKSFGDEERYHNTCGCARRAERWHRAAPRGAGSVPPQGVHQQQLSRQGVGRNLRPAELLLMHALGRDRAWIYEHPDDAIPDEAAQSYSALIARRAAGEPTQHLTGKQEFWTLEFEVTPDVLIPRPETEHLIEVALDRLGVPEVRVGPSARS